MNADGTILVVDDTPANLLLLVDTLAAEGYHVRESESGLRALEMVLADPPDLILLDIRMPVMDGFEVYRQLQARPEARDIPVVFISASGEGEERVRGLELGAVDFISKPFRREELLARVHTHLELRRLRVRLEVQSEGLRRINEQLRIELEERKRAEKALSDKNDDLAAALSSVKSLSGLLPICAACKKIRDDQGYWSQVECYVEEHSEATFTHGMCPECVKKWYPDLDGTVPESSSGKAR